MKRITFSIETREESSLYQEMFTLILEPGIYSSAEALLGGRKDIAIGNELQILEAIQFFMEKKGFIDP